jgi:hypothetical protein
MDAIQNLTAINFDVGGSFDPNTDMAFCQANDIDGYAVTGQDNLLADLSGKDKHFKILFANTLGVIKTRLSFQQREGTSRN